MSLPSASRRPLALHLQHVPRQCRLRYRHMQRQLSRTGPLKRPRLRPATPKRTAQLARAARPRRPRRGVGGDCSVPRRRPCWMRATGRGKPCCGGGGTARQFSWWRRSSPPSEPVALRRRIAAQHARLSSSHRSPPPGLPRARLARGSHGDRPGRQAEASGPSIASRCHPSHPKQNPAPGTKHRITQQGQRRSIGA